MPQIVTLTMNPALDKSAAIDRVVPDRKLYCRQPSWEPGGGGVNVARVVTRLGGAPLALYPAGGPYGQMFQELLAEAGVEQRVIPIEGLTRESFAVLEETTDQQYRFSTPGPTLSEEAWRRCLDVLPETAPDYLVVSGGLPLGVPGDFYGRVARWAHTQGCRVILDTHDEALRQGIAQGVFLVKPNLRELRQLMESDLEGEAEQEEALRQILAEGGAQYVVLSLGAAGAVFASEDGVRRLRAPTVTIRSKVGAGDSMVGGIVWALAEGFSPLEAARYGVAAGSAAVMTPGTELCRRKDVQELHNQMAEEGMA